MCGQNVSPHVRHVQRRHDFVLLGFDCTASCGVRQASKLAGDADKMAPNQLAGVGGAAPVDALKDKGGAGAKAGGKGKAGGRGKK